MINPRVFLEFVFLVFLEHLTLLHWRVGVVPFNPKKEEMWQRTEKKEVIIQNKVYFEPEQVPPHTHTHKCAYSLFTASMHDGTFPHRHVVRDIIHYL